MRDCDRFSEHEMSYAVLVTYDHSSLQEVLMISDRCPEGIYDTDSVDALSIDAYVDASFYLFTGTPQEAEEAIIIASSYMNATLEVIPAVADYEHFTATIENLLDV